MDIIEKIAKQLSDIKHKNKSKEDIETFLRKHLKPITKTKTVPSQYTDSFEKFWKVYPNKTGKRDAFKKYYRLGQPLEECITALSWQKSKWNDPQYIPLAATYLNKQLYQDDYIPQNHTIEMSESDMFSML